MTSLRKGELPYRPCVGAMMFSADGLVFVGYRVGDEIKLHAWQMPQGGIDDGETARDALMREVYEETGTDKFDILSESADWYQYDLPEELIGKVWKGRYRGQKQKWFAIRFTGSDEDFDLNVTDRPEFTRWKWISIDELAELIVPFKRQVYQGVIAEFRHFSQVSAR